MANGVSRIVRVVLLVLGVVAAYGPLAEAGLLGNAVVKGRVTNACNEGIACGAVSGAKVEVEIVASPSNSIVDGTLLGPKFWGQHQIVSTASDGTYQVTVGLPDDIPLKHLYARVVIAKLAGPPNFIMERRTLALSAGPATYTADAVLHLVGYGAAGPNGPIAFVTGTFRDKETGQRLTGTSVDDGALTSAACSPGNFFIADGDGDFFGTIPTHPGACGSSTLNLRLGADRAFTRVSTNGFSYLNQQRTVATSGKLILNVDLDRDATRPVIVGRVVNGATGKPISHALVRTSQGTGYKYAVTDSFGRYAVPVETPVSIIVETNGAFLDISDTTAPYLSQRADLSGRLMDGQVFGLDFSMVPKCK